MRCLVLIAVVITGTVARPETYREKEDFQYSRSSSDEGSKAGYYGAQRGNMGGNYERAHNMDSLAQHQMSGLIHQVEGEIGDTSNTNAGSVYTAANSRGMYGSGHYDLSNLEGRNFQEGTSYGESASRSALTNSAYRNHASGSNSYSNSNSHSHSSRHSSLDRSEHEQREEIHSSNLRSGEHAYQQEQGAYGGSSSQGYSWSPYQNRLVSTRPMRILVRPGTKVTVPIATQTYDADHSASAYDASAYNHNAANSASAYDASAYNHNAAKSDAEVIINNNQETSNRQVPASKHYESSYSYRKEWEKHHNSPGAVPLGVDIDSSVPKTSELYDDSQHTQTDNNKHQYASNAADSHSHQSSNLYGYNSRNTLASSSQSRQHSDYDVQRERLSSDLNALTLNTQQSHLNQDYANQQGSVNSKPKSYQSSYSYHKSWERQGDPYIIVPDIRNNVPNDPALQGLSTANSHSGYSSHQYGLNRKQSHQSYTNTHGLMDCDEEGHIRVARSYNTDQEVQQQQNGWEDFGQQSQNLWDGQQIQNNWDQNEDLGQQAQTHFDKIEDLGQQSQNQWNNIEDLGQQTQTHFDKIEDLGQQTQTQFDKFENLGQQTQTQFDKIEDLGQQTQTQFDKFEDLGQQTQTQFDKMEDLGQQTQTQFDKIEDLGQHTQSQWDKYNQFDQQSQSNVGQEQATWNNLEKSNEDKLYTNEIHRDQSYSNSNTFVDNVTHYTDKQVENGYQEQTVEQQSNFYTHLPNDFHTHHTDETLSDSRTQQTSSINSLWDKLDRLNRESTFNSNQDINEYTSFIDSEHPSNISKESMTTEKVLVNDQTVAYPKDLGRGDIPDTNVLHPKNIGRGDIPDTPEGLELLKHSSTTEKLNVISTTASDIGKRNKTDYGTLHNIEVLGLTTKHEITEKPKKDSDKTNTNNEMNIINQQIEHSSNSHNVNRNFQGKQVLQEKDQHSTNHRFENFNSEQGENVYEEIMKHTQTSGLSENENKLHFNQGFIDLSKLKENNNQQNVNHHYVLDHQSENLDQKNMQQETQQFEKPVDVFYQQNADQNLEYFSKWNENLDQHSMNHHPEGFDQQNEQNVEKETQYLEKPAEIAEQQNLDQNLVDFSTWNENLDHHNMNKHPDGFHHQNQQNIEQETQNFQKPAVVEDQQNLDQNLVDFSKWNENLDQHSMNHHHDGFDQQNQQNMEQETQHFDKPVEIVDQQSFENPGGSFDPQNLNENFDKPNNHYGFNLPSENFNQQNIEQEFQSFLSPNEGFDQLNVHQHVDDISHFSENAHQQSTHQQSVSFYQHSEYSNQQQKMEQELQSLDKLSDSFDQQHFNGISDEPKNHYFDLPSENLQQQNTEQESQNFLNPSESFDQQKGQELQNFDKSVEILDQQNLNQNLVDFSQINENFDEKNRNQGNQDFSKPTNSFDHQQSNNFIERLNQNSNKHNLEHQSYNQHDFATGRENSELQMHQSYRSPVPEDDIVQKYAAETNLEHLEMQHNNKLLSTQQTEQHTVSQTTLSPEPEPGFWASVGKKFTSAKDKVSSWFRKKSD